MVNQNVEKIEQSDKDFQYYRMFPCMENEHSLAQGDDWIEYDSVLWSYKWEWEIKKENTIYYFL